MSVFRRLEWTALACVILSGGVEASALAGPSHNSVDQYQRWAGSAATILAAQQNANSLATAAALRFAASIGVPKGQSLKPQNDALDLASRASELAPQSAGIGWLRLQLCADAAYCDIRDAATAMRWVDADNAAAWIHTLSNAVREKDTVEIERVLGDMAHGGRFDIYWNRLVVLMADVLRAAHHDLPGSFAASDASRLEIASAVATAELTPKLSPLIEACREPGTDRRDACLKLAKTMQRGDAIIVQLAGIGIERHLRNPDSKEARLLAERRHTLVWRQAAATEADAQGLPWSRNAHARLRLAHMRILGREEDVCIAILKDNHMALDPPEIHP